jgi:hypothetical protein
VEEVSRQIRIALVRAVNGSVAVNAPKVSHVPIDVTLMVEEMYLVFPLSVPVERAIVTLLGVPP